MNFLAQRIAPAQDACQPMRQSIDHGDFQTEPPVVDRGSKTIALAQKLFGARRKPAKAFAQRRRRALGAQRLDADAARGQGVLRNIDAVEFAIVVTAVLQMIDDL